MNLNQLEQVASVGSQLKLASVQLQCSSLDLELVMRKLLILHYRNIDDVDQTMDEINEQTDNLRQIQEALASPIGGAADFDEDELEVELEELEGAELEEQLLQPAITAPIAPIKAIRT
ncbi:vacuolar protein sorting-associated protein 32 homolog 2-like [Spinacia oleracea]|uniref:Vacuolar protein sorting-associated protein 32 homolog 2-like n=1 Tax=Spinacia oleracea TaxID=3562 RepID=A0ABM3RHS5_SPIOL|nr:vacuolar protein sorting-associated protein 32 homolog 2-like [Spinacia oleracea]